MSFDEEHIDPHGECRHEIKRAGHLLMSARRYVESYSKEDNYHPQAREVARDLFRQINEFLQHS